MGGHLSIEVERDRLDVVDLPEGLTIVRAPRVPTT